MSIPKDSHAWLRAVKAAALSARANHTARAFADMVRWKGDDPLYGLAWPGPRKLASEMAVSEKTAKRGLAELTKAGLLATVGCSVCDARRGMRSEVGGHHGRPGQGHTAVREARMRVTDDPGNGVTDDPGNGVSDDPGNGVTSDPRTTKGNNKRTGESGVPETGPLDSALARLARDDDQVVPVAEPGGKVDGAGWTRTSEGWSCDYCGLGSRVPPAENPALLEGCCPRCEGGRLSRRHVAAKLAKQPTKTKTRTEDDPRACGRPGCRGVIIGRGLCNEHYWESQGNQCGESRCTEAALEGSGYCGEHPSKPDPGRGDHPGRSEPEPVRVRRRTGSSSSGLCHNCREETGAVYPCPVCHYDPEEESPSPSEGLFPLLGLDELRAMASASGP